MGGQTLAVTITLLALGASEHLRHRNLQETATPKYKRLGCFGDKGDDRILGERMYNEEQQSTDFCYDYCAAMGAPLMATQWGIECWCATEVVVETDFKRHGEDEVKEEVSCDYPCPGNPDEMCGGFWAMDLYSLVEEDEDNDVGGSTKTVTPAPVTPAPVTPAPVTPAPVTPEEPETAPVTPEEPETAPKGALEDDIVKIITVDGMDPGGESWADSYSDGDKCYMWTNLDHDIADVKVDTPLGEMTVKDLYETLKNVDPGPGHTGKALYNDIQCGNGPANSAADETKCPGLVEHGAEGCGQIGPKWDLSVLQK